MSQPTTSSQAEGVGQNVAPMEVVPEVVVNQKIEFRYKFALIVQKAGTIMDLDPKELSGSMKIMSHLLNYLKFCRQRFNTTTSFPDVAPPLLTGNRENRTINYPNRNGVMTSITFSALDVVLYPVLKEWFSEFTLQSTGLRGRQTFFGEVMKMACLWNLFHCRVKEIQMSPVGKTRRVITGNTRRQPISDWGLPQNHFIFATGLNFPDQVRSSLASSMGPFVNMIAMWETKGTNYFESYRRAFMSSMTANSDIAQAFCDAINRTDLDVNAGKALMYKMGMCITTGAFRINRRYAFPPCILYECSLAKRDHKFSGIDPVIIYNEWSNARTFPNHFFIAICKAAFTGVYLDDLAYFAKVTGSRFRRSEIPEKTFPMFSKEFTDAGETGGMIEEMAPLTKGSYAQLGGRGNQESVMESISGYGTKNRKIYYHSISEKKTMSSGNVAADLQALFNSLIKRMKSGNTRGTAKWMKWGNGKFNDTINTVTEQGLGFYSHQDQEDTLNRPSKKRKIAYESDSEEDL